MLSVTFVYDGEDEVVATCAGLEPSTTYTLSINDPDSTVASGDSDGSGDLVLTVSDIGGLSTDDPFVCAVGDADGNPTVAVALFTFGTAGTETSGRSAESYATTAELFRILSKNNPSDAQTAAAQGDLDTATLEINAEIDLAPGSTLDAAALALVKGVCLDRAADLWRHRESAPGILNIGDESIPAAPGRYSWSRYTARLSPLKDQWGIA